MMSIVFIGGLNMDGAVRGIRFTVTWKLLACHDFLRVPGSSDAQQAGAAEAIAEARVLLLQLEVPLPAIVRAAAIASDRGVRVILNAAPACLLPAELMRMVHYLVVNELEAALLSGLDPSRPQEAAEALR